MTTLADIAKQTPQPEDVFFEVGNIFAKRILLPKKGDATIGHSHTFDHMTLVARGSVEISVLGKESKRYVQDEIILIEAGLHHSIIALEDNSALYCIHDTRGLAHDALGQPYDYEAHHV